jgi:dynein heavy chain 2
VNLSDLLHPETFLNAFRQKSARMFTVAIDELKLVSSFDQSKINQQASIEVQGLWLQGCAFGGSRLTDIQGKASEIIQLPSCYISWISDKEADPYPSGVVESPLYHNMDREKLLCTLKIFNQGEASTRIISGVALFLNGSE